MESSLIFKVDELEREFSMCLLDRLQGTPLDLQASALVVGVASEPLIDSCLIIPSGTYGKWDRQQRVYRMESRPTLTRLRYPFKADWQPHKADLHHPFGHILPYVVG